MSGTQAVTGQRERGAITMQPSRNTPASNKPDNNGSDIQRLANTSQLTKIGLLKYAGNTPKSPQEIIQAINEYFQGEIDEKKTNQLHYLAKSLLIPLTEPGRFYGENDRNNADILKDIGNDLHPFLQRSQDLHNNLSAARTSLGEQQAYMNRNTLLLAKLESEIQPVVDNTDQLESLLSRLEKKMDNVYFNVKGMSKSRVTQLKRQRNNELNRQINDTLSASTYLIKKPMSASIRKSVESMVSRLEEHTFGDRKDLADLLNSTQYQDITQEEQSIKTLQENIDQAESNMRDLSSTIKNLGEKISRLTTPAVSSPSDIGEETTHTSGTSEEVHGRLLALGSANFYAQKAKAVASRSNQQYLLYSYSDSRETLQKDIQTIKDWKPLFTWGGCAAGAVIGLFSSSKVPTFIGKAGVMIAGCGLGAVAGDSIHSSTAYERAIKTFMKTSYLTPENVQEVMGIDPTLNPKALVEFFDQ